MKSITKRMTGLSQNKDILQVYVDLDLDRDLMNRKSVSSIIHLFNSVVIAYDAVKWTKVKPCTNNAEIEAIFKITRKKIIFSKIIGIINMCKLLSEPTPLHKENTVAIT